MSWKVFSKEVCEMEESTGRKLDDLRVQKSTINRGKYPLSLTLRRRLRAYGGGLVVDGGKMVWKGTLSKLDPTRPKIDPSSHKHRTVHRFPCLIRGHFSRSSISVLTLDGIIFRLLFFGLCAVVVPYEQGSSDEPSHFHAACVLSMLLGIFPRSHIPGILFRP